MSLKIWPIAQLPGGWSVPESGLAAIWAQMVQEGRAEEVFYDGGVSAVEQWLAFIRHPANMPVLIIDETRGNPVFLAWVNNIRPGSAQLHFCGLGPYRRDAGKLALQYFDAFEQSGPLFRVLLGITPEDNERALRLSKITGFEPIGRIPEFCWLADENRFGGAILSSRLHPAVR